MNCISISAIVITSWQTISQVENGMGWVFWWNLWSLEVREKILDWVIYLCLASDYQRPLLTCWCQSEVIVSRNVAISKLYVSTYAPSAVCVGHMVNSKQLLDARFIILYTSDVIRLYLFCDLKKSIPILS